MDEDIFFGNDGYREPIPAPFAERITDIHFMRPRCILVTHDGQRNEYTVGMLEESFPGLLAACIASAPHIDWSDYR